MTDQALQWMHVLVYNVQRVPVYTSTWGQIPLLGWEASRWLSRWQNNEYLHQLKIPWCCWTYQAGPALISQLAKVEPRKSFHPDHSVPDRGHLEFKWYGSNCAATSQLVLIITKLIKKKCSKNSNQTDFRSTLESKWWLLNPQFKSISDKTVTKLIPCILNLSVSHLLAWS